MGDAVIVGVAHEDGFFEHEDEGAGGLREETRSRFSVVGDEVVGDVAFGAGELVFEGAVEGAGG